MGFFNIWKNRNTLAVPNQDVFYTNIAANRITIKNFLVGLKSCMAYDRNKFAPILSPKTIQLWTLDTNTSVAATWVLLTVLHQPRRFDSCVRQLSKFHVEYMAMQKLCRHKRLESWKLKYRYFLKSSNYQPIKYPHKTALFPRKQQHFSPSSSSSY